MNYNKKLKSPLKCEIQYNLQYTKKSEKPIELKFRLLRHFKFRKLFEQEISPKLLLVRLGAQK